MRIRLLILSAFLAFASLKASASTQEDTNTLIQPEQKWIAASNAGDVDTLSAIVDDSYQANTPYGTHSKADMLRPVTGATQSVQNLTVVSSGDRATVSGENVVTVANGVVMRFAFTDSFAMKDGQWRAVNSYVTKQ
ncbi:SnoaL-like domain protein [Caballeronia glebae]|uniref:SnoaL-like domain protein n=1 Tax=Caballeronia glebae TaxID=1777143 RepID=A0A158AH83_9BURK|nr:nuclear transport factor 2 family protein [Caballeronia glebae]SAK57075.1 SnoaL-like domain protein [Caballeronia glebae]